MFMLHLFIPETEIVLAHCQSGFVLEEQIRLTSADAVPIVLRPNERPRQPSLDGICDGRQTSFGDFRDPFCKTSTVNLNEHPLNSPDTSQETSSS